MILDILSQFNWVDILIITLLIRIGYVSLKNGLAPEFFKLLGTLLALYLSLHYYTSVSDFFRRRFSTEAMPLEFLDFICVNILAVLGYLSFVLLRSVFCHFIKADAVPQLNKWGGLVLGAFRGVLLVSLITFTLAISSITYLKDSVKNSYSVAHVLKIAPNTYSWIWNKFMSKFMTAEDFNKSVLEVQENFSR